MKMGVMTDRAVDDRSSGMKLVSIILPVGVGAQPSRPP
jgi:hypothetical protein